jgi:hypothetical protein
MKPGRSEAGVDPIVATRVPPDVLERIDAWGSSMACSSRSEAARRLLLLGLDKAAPGARVEFGKKSK